jgi:hypothetical protein
MAPKLLAFDLDGTLLTTDKRLSPRNRAALIDMVGSGAKLVLASGRLRSSMRRIAQQIEAHVSMLALNGAVVYESDHPDEEPVFSLGLPERYSRELLSFAVGRDFALNFYRDDRVVSMRTPSTEPWIALYVQQTSSEYEFVGSYEELAAARADKIIFVGAEATLDEVEVHFRARFGDDVYIVRTWNHYLEFLHRDVNKGVALRALAERLGVPLSEVAAFGDSDNDIPMLDIVGHPVAMANATDAVKARARYVSPFSNDEDGVAREWERLKAL